MKKNIQEKQKILTVSIIIVALLLLVNLVLLLLTKRQVDTAGADGNVIGEVKATETHALATPALLRVTPAPTRLFAATASGSESLSLTFWNGYDEKKSFEVTGMLPGDSYTKEYKVTVRSRRAAALDFAIEITEDSLLSNCLIFTVSVNDETEPLYRGTLVNMPVLLTDLDQGSSSQEILYRITAELPTSAGNEYAQLSLSTRFVWTLAETEPVPVVTYPTETKPVETETEPEETEPAETDPIETYPTDTEPPMSEPFETEPPLEPDAPHAPIPENCTRCVVDTLLENLFHVERERCIVCDAIVSIFNVEETACICPYGCIVVAVLTVSTPVVVTFTVTHCVRRYRRKRKARREAAKKDRSDKQ